MDGPTLRDAMLGNEPPGYYGPLAPAFTKALHQAGCHTVKRAAMFCAQIGHESAGLRYMEELASGKEYEGRRDLGNIHPGDGPRYKGRGPIQITGRANYREVSEWAHAKGIVPSRTYFVDHPQQLASHDYGFLGAVWYWTVARDMNHYADRDDIVGATKAVNGGTNGLDDREMRWHHCLKMGDRLVKGIKP